MVPYSIKPHGFGRVRQLKALIFIYKYIPFNTVWSTEMSHLDKHWIAGILVGLELLAMAVKQDGLGPQDQHNVVGVRSCAHNSFITTSD
jgi:hypothetical protein